MQQNIQYLLNASDLESVVKKVLHEVLNELRPKDEDKLLTVAETVELLKIDRTTLWRWEKAKYLVPVRLGNRVRYKESDIIKFSK